MSESGLKKIGVIGIGTMGNGIAQVAAQSGFDVTVMDVDSTVLERGMDAISRSLDRLVKAFEKSEGEKGITGEAKDEALGQVWHTPNAPAISSRQFVQKVLEITKTQPKVRVAPKLLVSLMGMFDPMMREINEILYQFEAPFLVDHSKFETTFGQDVTPLNAGIPQTVAWFKARRQA